MTGHGAGEVRCEEFLYQLKAGPAGGRLRRPSSRRQRHDGDRGASLTHHDRWSQSRHRRQLGHTWGMLQGTATDNPGYLRTARFGGSPARTPLTCTRSGTVPSMACKQSLTLLSNKLPHRLGMSMIPRKIRMKASNTSKTINAMARRHPGTRLRLAYRDDGGSGSHLVSFRPGSGNRGSGPSFSSGGMAPISRQERKARGQFQPQAARSRPARAKTAGPAASDCPRSGSQDVGPDLDTFPEALLAAQPRRSP